jgi:hypothetical protein
MLQILLMLSALAFAERPEGDFEPQYQTVCHCQCAALGLSRPIRVWDNVRKVHYYVWGGVSLYEYDALGENYGFRIPIPSDRSCALVEGARCTGLHRASVHSQPVRLEGRYATCRREYAPIRG